jgi:hypothetical protein
MKLKASVVFIFSVILASVIPASSQGRTTFTGTVLSYGSGLNTRVSTRTFTLTIDRITPDTDANRFLGVLQEGGQDALLNTIRNQEVGRFSVGGGLGRPLNAVRISNAGGKKRIVAVFERWVSIAELRGGYRSQDYPFGYIELIVDPRTGRGEGTYIAAAQIRFRTDKKTGESQVVIEDFGTFPSKLMGVTMRGTRLP